MTTVLFLILIAATLCAILVRLVPIAVVHGAYACAYPVFSARDQLVFLLSSRQVHRDDPWATDLYAVFNDCLRSVNSIHAGGFWRLLLASIIVRFSHARAAHVAPRLTGQSPPRNRVPVPLHSVARSGLSACLRLMRLHIVLRSFDHQAQRNRSRQSDPLFEKIERLQLSLGAS